MVRPEQALRVPGGWGPQISRQPAHAGGKVVSPMHRPPLQQPELFLVLISVRDWVETRAIIAAGRIMSIKNSNDTIGNGTRDFSVRLVVHCRNQQRHLVSTKYWCGILNFRVECCLMWQVRHPPLWWITRTCHYSVRVPAYLLVNKTRILTITVSPYFV
jgi:hypothetical protein